MYRLTAGFTLIELLIAVVILAIVSTVALPIYNDYIDTARQGTLVTNISTMEMFQEDFLLRNGTYFTSAANVAAMGALGWAPQSNDGTTYTITDPGGGSYDVTATAGDGTAVCMRFPAKVRC